MIYIYITNNNLEDRQNYMYSAFGGKEFLHAYVDSRQKFIDHFDSNKVVHDTLQDVLWISSVLEKSDNEDLKCACFKLFECYVKRFEVSKRIYTAYNEKWRAADNAVYDHYELYLLLSDCCLKAYRITDCIKYFSCMLKIDDTLLSLDGKMTDVERKWLSDLLKSELDIFKELTVKSEVGI